MRNYFLIIGSTSYFDDYLSKIDVEKDSFIELVRQDDTQRKGGVITWDPSPNLVVRNSDYHGLVASAHDRLGELIKEFTTEDAYSNNSLQSEMRHRVDLMSTLSINAPR